MTKSEFWINLKFCQVTSSSVKMYKLAPVQLWFSNRVALQNLKKKYIYFVTVAQVRWNDNKWMERQTPDKMWSEKLTRALA